MVGVAVLVVAGSVIVSVAVICFSNNTFKKHYVTNEMSLCQHATKSIGKLRKLAKMSYDRIPENDQTPASATKITLHSAVQCGSYNEARSALLFRHAC